LMLTLFLSPAELLQLCKNGSLNNYHTLWSTGSLDLLVWACEAYHGIHVLLLVAALEITNCPRTMLRTQWVIVQIDVFFSEEGGWYSLPNNQRQLGLWNISMSKQVPEPLNSI
jgi:hypothetical protein